jgi:predicted dehydrogenase
MTNDARSVFRDPAVDAVAIATPISTHYPLAKEAFEAGKHALVEKPLTVGVAEAKELIALAEARGLTLMVDHTFLFHGAVTKMKEIIEAGEMGRLYYYDSVRVNLGLFQHDVSVLWDLATHDVAIMQYLLNKRPVSVSAVGVSHFQGGLENIAYLTVHLENDLIAHFHVNWLAPVKIRKVLIGGSERMIVYDDLKADEKVCVFDRGVNMEPGFPKDRYRARVEYRMGDMLAPKLDGTEPLRRMCQHFVDCVHGRVKPISDGPFGLEVVRVLEAAEQSMRKNGQRVSL